MSEVRVTVVFRRDDNDGSVEAQVLGGVTVSGMSAGNPLETGKVFKGADATEALSALGAAVDDSYTKAASQTT